MDDKLRHRLLKQIQKLEEDIRTLKHDLSVARHPSTIAVLKFWLQMKTLKLELLKRQLNKL